MRWDAWGDAGKSATPSAAAHELPELVRRAGAILAQATPIAPGVLPTAGGLPTPGALPLSPGSLSQIDDLRRRALDLVGELFATFGAPGVASLPLASVVPSAPADPVGVARAVASAAQLPWRAPGSAARPGDTVTLPLSIANPDSVAREVGFYSTDLLSDSGRSIPGHDVAFDPPRLALAPGQRATVTARIPVPLQATPGAYSGLVQTAGLPAEKSVLTIQVG